MIPTLFIPPQVNATEQQIYLFREEEENSMHNTVVIFSSTDMFTLKQVSSSGL